MEGGNDCDSNAEGLKNRKKGKDARLGDGGLGWEMEDQALGGKKEKDVRAGTCWQKERGKGGGKKRE